MPATSGRSMARPSGIAPVKFGQLPVHVLCVRPLERLNKEVKRRARVVGIFPNDASVIRLVGAVPVHHKHARIVTRFCGRHPRGSTYPRPSPKPQARANVSGPRAAEGRIATRT
jgi:Transposase, Mutator family